MAFKRRPATSQVPLARVALLAGEAFGHHSVSDGLAENPPDTQARSALIVVLIVCVLAAAYLAV